MTNCHTSFELFLKVPHSIGRTSPIFDSLDQKISKRSAFVLKVRVKEFGTNDFESYP